MTENKPFPATFPVVFYDGKRDINAGDIEIQPFIDVKKLQSILCSKIGIATYQANYSIICRKNAKSARRIPIKDAIDFYGILEQEKDCYFLVSLRSSSSRRGGRRSGRNQKYMQEDTAADCEYFTSLQKRFLLHPPQLLLRRDCNAVMTATPYYNPISSSQLQTEKENYLMRMMNSYPYSEFKDVYEYEFGGNRGDGTGGSPACEVCLEATDGAVPFHWCVYDRTTAGFRSPAGPIQRPSKGEP